MAVWTVLVIIAVEAQDADEARAAVKDHMAVIDHSCDHWEMVGDPELDAES